MNRRLLLSALGAVVISSHAWAQTTSAVAPGAAAASTTAPKVSARDEAIREMVQKAHANIAAPFPIQDPFVSVIQDDQFIAMYLVAAAHDANPGSDAGKLVDALMARGAKQLGSTSTSTAGTTIASKGLVPDILGVAVESGAVNRETKGTTLTFQVTPMGVVKALQGKGLLDVYADYSTSAAERVASRFALSASFDTSRGTAGTFTGDGNQLSAWSVRAKVLDGRDPSKYADKWAGLLSGTTTAAFGSARTDTQMALAGWPGLATRRHKLQDRVATEVEAPLQKHTIDVPAAEAAFQKILEADLPGVVDKADAPPSLGIALGKYVSALAALQTDIETIYGFADKGPLVTVEWSTARDKALPDLYTVTGILEAGFGQGRATDFTLNAATAFYKDQPAGADHAFKSFDLNAEIDRPLGSVFSTKSLLFTLALRYSYLPNDTVASTATSTTGAAAGGSGPSMAAPALKGHIGVVQFKFTLPVSTGVQIPLSITASNRTELIKEKDVRASFGITFDLDSVLGIAGIR